MKMCRVKTKHTQLDPTKQPPLGKGRVATFKKVLFTVTNEIWQDHTMGWLWMEPSNTVKLHLESIIYI